MLSAAKTYQELQRNFRWNIPQIYNIATDACDRWAAREPRRVALIDLKDDGPRRDTSYGQLSQNSRRLANGLKAHGVERGDRVALLLPQSVETALGHLAIYRLGSVAVPLAALFGVEALKYRLANSGAKAVLTNEAGLAKLIAIRGELPDLRLILSVDGPDTGVLDFHQLIDKSSDHFETARTRPDDPAMMIYTSGTTGAPKGALHGHRVLPGHMPGIQMTHEFLPQPGDLFWTPADWAWAGGLLNALLPCLRSGVPVVAHRFEKFDPEKAFSLMSNLGVRNAFIPPTALKILRTVPAPSRRFALSLRSIGSAGEALGKETYEWARESLDITVNEFYGQTEANAVLASCAQIGVSKSGSIGRAVPGHEMAIVDEEGTPLPAGAQGQIAIKRVSPVLFLEYWRQPDATKGKFIGEWMVTGDQGVMDEEGYFRFIGRNDDVITSAGYRIGPAEIEDCLISHPAIALAAAIGKPDPIRTEIVKSYVVLKDGYAASDTLTDEIRDWVRNRLSAHEYPREIEFVDNLPMTTTGKVIRRRLREQTQNEVKITDE